MNKIGNFFHTVFVKAVWQTFCVEWVWKTFCVAWVWKTFCVAWVYQAFWKELIVRKLRFDTWKGWVYLFPALVLIAVFTVWPIFNTVRIAFLEGYSTLGETGGESYNFGLGNFIDVIQNDDEFLTAMKNTILLCVLTVPLSTAIALLIAVCLNAIKPLQKLLQTIFFLPYVTNSLAIGMVFAVMFDIVGTGLGTMRPIIKTAGIMNTMLGWFGAGPINWIDSGSTYGTKLAVMVIYIVWNALPFKILVLLGGLQGINKQYYDAAKIDGASRSRIFFRVTVPLLSPMIAYVVITGFIGGFKEYTSVVGIFGENMGPVGQFGSMQTMVGLVYKALEDDNAGRASAAALLLFCLIFIVTMIHLRVSKKKTHY
ncbi:MAG: sugar ABC transporter permease [Clostridia bacterium]|nr:sugar ABC transporter permease [Clostridia bacterium]